MKIYSVTDAAFRPYGKILEGYDTAPLCAAMRSIPMPEQGTAYEPSIPVLEECALYGALQNNAYGGMPIQLGLCWGYNTRLNCLEYHRDSEVNVGARDFILLLGKQDEIENGVLDTGKVKAFRVQGDPGDYIKMYVIIAIMLIGGFAVLGGIIRKININKALKLGED